MYCDFDEPSLPNYVWIDVNWDVRLLDEPPWIIGHDYGRITLKDDYDGEVLWEGIYNGFFYEDGSSSRLTILHGVGDYEGLKVQATVSVNTLDEIWVPLFVGEIINPRK
jgi:hypothetical protein